MVNDVLQTVDELPHLPGGDPACALRGRIDLAISRSFPIIGAWVIVTRGWKSSIEKLAVVSRVFVRWASGAPAGGSAIDPGSAPARYTATTIYIAISTTLRVVA